MKIEISEQKIEISSRVSGLLSPVIADLILRLKDAKGSDIGKQVAALRDTVENVVRPMSQSVVNAPSNLSEPSYSQNRYGMFRRLNFEAKLRLRDVFLPSMSAFLLVIVSLPSALSIAGAVNGIILVLCLGLCAFGVLRIAKYLLRDLELSTLFAAIIHGVVHLIIGLVTLISIYLVDHTLLGPFTSRVLILLLVFGLTLFIGQARYIHLVRAKKELQLVNTELEKLNAQAKQELWVSRRRIATVLHGPIQAALYSSAIRLAQAKRPTKKLIELVNEDLTEALRALNFDQNVKLSVKTVLHEITEVWSGVAEIYVSIPKTVYDVTKKNVNAAEAFVEIIREAVSNAIKHGAADEIEITAKFNEGILSLRVLNNGKLPNEKQASTGYGTQILNELALGWELTSSNGKALFSAEIVAAI
jgi:signal transduction histidine kinase